MWPPEAGAREAVLEAILLYVRAGSLNKPPAKWQSVNLLSADSRHADSYKPNMMMPNARWPWRRGRASAQPAWERM